MKMDLDLGPSFKFLKTQIILKIQGRTCGYIYFLQRKNQVRPCVSLLGLPLQNTTDQVA